AGPARAGAARSRRARAGSAPGRAGPSRTAPAAGRHARADCFGFVDVCQRSGNDQREQRTRLPANATHVNTQDHPNSFSARDTLRVGGREYRYWRLTALGDRFDLATLPYSLKILLENLVRFEDGRSVTQADVEALASWQPGKPSTKEIAYRPARVLLQDFTGVPC